MASYHGSSPAPSYHSASSSDRRTRQPSASSARNTAVHPLNGGSALQAAANHLQPSTGILGSRITAPAPMLPDYGQDEGPPFYMPGDPPRGPDWIGYIDPNAGPVRPRMIPGVPQAAVTEAYNEQMARESERETRILAGMPPSPDPSSDGQSASRGTASPSSLPFDLQEMYEALEEEAPSDPPSGLLWPHDLPPMAGPSDLRGFDVNAWRQHEIERQDDFFREARRRQEQAAYYEALQAQQQQLEHRQREAMLQEEQEREQLYQQAIAAAAAAARVAAHEAASTSDEQLCASSYPGTSSSPSSPYRGRRYRERYERP